MAKFLIKLTEEEFTGIVEKGNIIGRVRAKEYQEKRFHDKDVKGICGDFGRGFPSEFAVYKFFNPQIVDTPPDFELREQGKRKYDPDLVVLNQNLHVKSARSKGYYRDSWTFGNKDSVVRSGKKNNWFVGVTVIDDLTYEITAILPLDKLVAQNFFGGSLKASMKTKTCLYLNDKRDGSGNMVSGINRLDLESELINFLETLDEEYRKRNT